MLKKAYLQERCKMSDTLLKGAIAPLANFLVTIGLSLIAPAIFIAATFGFSLLFPGLIIDTTFLTIYFLIMCTASTMTRCFLPSTAITLPRLPLSAPAITTTSSFFLT